MEAAWQRATLNTGSLLIAVGVLSFFSSSNWISAILTISAGSKLVQMARQPTAAVPGCCNRMPGQAFALREDSLGARGLLPTFNCCGCGCRTNATGKLNSIRSVAITAIFFAFAEFWTAFIISMIVGRE